MRITSRIAAVAALLALAAPAAHAQAFRTYLALEGDDANPCTREQPCRLLPAALAAVQEGGEVWMLDSANYNTGPVTVDKAVTILAVPGALGSVVALGGNALNITTTGTVTLRNLNVHPYPGNANFFGVLKATTGTLLIRDSNLFGFTGGSAAAVRINASADVTITRSVIRDNRVGVQVNGSAPVVGISDSLFTGHSNAGVLLASQTGKVTVTRTAARANVRAFHASGASISSNQTLRVVDARIECSSKDSTAGVAVFAISIAPAAATVAGTSISGCDSGVEAGGPNVKVLLSRNTITDNAIGVQQVGALVESDGTNAMRHNALDVYGDLVTVDSM